MARKKKTEASDAPEAQAPNLVLSNPGVPASEEQTAPESPRRVRTINGMTIIDN